MISSSVSATCNALPATAFSRSCATILTPIAALISASGQIHNGEREGDDLVATRGGVEDNKDAF